MPPSIQVPTTIPMMSMMRMAGAEALMVSLMPFSISSQVKPLETPAIAATIVAITRGMCAEVPSRLMPQRISANTQIKTTSAFPKPTVFFVSVAEFIFYSSQKM